MKLISKLTFEERQALINKIKEHDIFVREIEFQEGKFILGVAGTMCYDTGQVEMIIKNVLHRRTL